MLQTVGTIHGRHYPRISAERFYDVSAKIIFGYEEPSLIPYVLTENSAYGSNGPGITVEHPGLMETETMSCLATTIAFYCTKKTHDNGDLPKTGRAISLPLRPAD